MPFMVMKRLIKRIEVLIAFRLYINGMSLWDASPFVVEVLDVS